VKSKDVSDRLSIYFTPTFPNLHRLHLRLMTLPPDSSPDSTSEFEAALAELKQALQEIESRYAQIQRDTQLRDELRQRQKYLETQRHRRRDPQLQAELKQIAERLAELDVNLESSLVSWETFREPFWQAVRFGGLGIVIGWVLKSIVASG